MPEYNVRIKIRSPRCLRPGEDKNWEIFGKIVRIKNPDFGSFRLRHPSVLSGVLEYPISVRIKTGKTTLVPDEFLDRGARHGTVWYTAI